MLNGYRFPFLGIYGVRQIQVNKWKWYMYSNKVTYPSMQYIWQSGHQVNNKIKIK